eukprot:4413433-Prymnesium_polylepis.1
MYSTVSPCAALGAKRISHVEDLAEYLILQYLGHIPLLLDLAPEIHASCWFGQSGWGARSSPALMVMPHAKCEKSENLRASNRASRISSADRGWNVEKENDFREENFAAATTIESDQCAMPMAIGTVAQRVIHRAPMNGCWITFSAGRSVCCYSRNSFGEGAPPPLQIR